MQSLGYKCIQRSFYNIRTGYFKVPVIKNNTRVHIKQSYISRLSTQAVNAPETSKIVGKWMLCCGGLVYGAVLLGGVTRLTESGLSMVTWKFFGEKVPLSKLDWEEEFKRYQQFPEFKMKNRTMSLEEFKFIYFMEYFHRMWGRIIGIAFLVPAAIFWRRGYFTPATKKRVILLGSLIGAQGLMGWYMVKSGLENRFDDVNDVPRVSQYRLASHLTLAFTLYAFFLTGGLSILLPPEKLVAHSMQSIWFRRMAHSVKGLAFLTAISGAFVAGLDAGLVYNSFPKMGDKWLPEELFLFNPVQKNFTENPTTVQFNHRILGVSTVALVSALWLFSRRLVLPKRARYAINAACIMGWTQATLGVTTLLNHVPIQLATAHQSGSIFLLSCAFWLTHELKYIKYLPK